MRVWVYPDREYRELGEVSWLVEWATVREGVVVEEGKEFDFDRDLVDNERRFASADEGRKYARELLERGNLFFGTVSLQKQVVDWFVEGDRVAEWRDSGDEETIE